MGNMWKKVKVALGLKLCVFVPSALDEEERPQPETGRASDSFTTGAVDSAESRGSEYCLLGSISSASTASGLLSKSVRRSYKKTCAICLGNIKAGNGALFTAECSHAFHFNCIASNVKHGNRVCPVCRAKWMEVPFLSPPSTNHARGGGTVIPFSRPQDDGMMVLLRRLPRVGSPGPDRLSPVFNISEPNVYDDDEPIVVSSEAAIDSEPRLIRVVHIQAFPEFSAIPKMASEETFSILIHLKAPPVQIPTCPEKSIRSPLTSQASRAPADLVTVLDISGSMAGTKLALLKRAMDFVILNLGCSDRLSIIAFSSTAHRLFPLRCMTETGRQHALQAVNSLVSGGGTNISEGLRKGTKVIVERKNKNPICSIILLSDGQDTYTISSSRSVTNSMLPDYQFLVPSFIRGNTSLQVPVHAFGFGADHDSVSMHSISERSGGTFSFIESERSIQDAFAQCIGGLLSVVVQELLLEVECMHPGVQLAPIRSGSYASRVVDGTKGSISIGDLYADEERDFLVSVNVPPVVDDEEIVLLRVGCSYRDPFSNEAVKLIGEDVRIQRLESVAERGISIQVDRERNRLLAAEAMDEARAAAERGALSEAVSILENRRAMLSASFAAQSGDMLCVALDAELRELQERMESRQRYEESGRAYVLSGLSSHSWQRATARGDSTDSRSLLHSYKTPSMVDMLQRSQTLCSLPMRTKPPIRPTKSFMSRTNLR